MPTAACIMMQKDEAFLLRPWLAYHGYLFGYENLFVFDNGSTLPNVRATLTEFARKGVNVDWDHASRDDYLAKGELIGDRIRTLEAAGEYDFMIPLDCDEFMLLRTEQDFSCSRDDILTYLATLTGEKRTLRVPYQFANHPLVPDIYHRHEFFKVFFASGSFSPIDHGHHVAEQDQWTPPRDTKLVHLHFHYKMFDAKLAEARQSWVGTVDVDDLATLANYGGPSAHLTRYFLRDKEAYYRGFLDTVHFYLPHFRVLLTELSATLDLPVEAVPEYLQLRVAELDSAANNLENGAVILIPVTNENRQVRGSGAVEFRATRFHEGHYLKANPALAHADIDPTVHYCIHGFREGRLLRPPVDPVRDANATRRAIAAYIAGEGRMTPGPDRMRCLELGCGVGRRPSGWLMTDLDPTDDQVHLDVTEPFPIESESFDYVYSQHMIEHLPFESGRFMVRECFRVLKPGGTMRIVTPSIDFLFRLFSSRESTLVDRYIKWVTKEFAPNAPRPLASIVFNNFVRARGHQFIYDRATLQLILEEAGFSDIRERQIGQSDQAKLRDLETIDRLPDGFLELESMILEATRPPAGL